MISLGGTRLCECRQSGSGAAALAKTRTALQDGTLVFPRLTAHIEAIITEPRIDRQSEGFLNFKADLNVLHSTFSFKQLKEKNEEIVKMLEKTIKGSKLN